MSRLRELRPGDRVEVCVSPEGRAVMTLAVTDVTADSVVCGPWTYDLDTSMEVDEELGWGPAHGITGSWIRALPLEPLRVRFRTETGSVYEIARDGRGMRWSRLSATLASGPLRSSSPWPLLRWPRLALGEGVELVGPPYVEDSEARVVLTTRVVEIVEDEPGGGQS